MRRSLRVSSIEDVLTFGSHELVFKNGPRDLETGHSTRVLWYMGDDWGMNDDEKAKLNEACDTCKKGDRAAMTDVCSCSDFTPSYEMGAVVCYDHEGNVVALKTGYGDEGHNPLMQLSAHLITRTYGPEESYGLTLELEPKGSMLLVKVIDMQDNSYGEDVHIRQELRRLIGELTYDPQKRAFINEDR